MNYPSASIRGAALAMALGLLAPAAVAQVCPDTLRDPDVIYLGTGSGYADCWVGPTWETGTTEAAAEVYLISGTRYIEAYRFSGATYNATALGFDSLYDLDCAATDTSGNGSWDGTVGTCSSDLRWLAAAAGTTGINRVCDYLGSDC
jgi:hypothetical protein